MSETTRTETRPEGGVLIEWAIMLGATAIAVLGFVTSFRAVKAKVHPTFGQLDWAVPTACDLGIFVFSAAHIYLLRRRESHWLLRLIPLALTGVTVYLNVSAGGSVTGVSASDEHVGAVAHGVMVSLWAAAVAVAEHVAKRRMKLDNNIEVEGIPFSRFFWDPIRTLLLKRRMVLAAERSYRRAVEMEKARLYAAGLVRVRYGPLWRWRNTPPLLRREVSGGDLSDTVVVAVDQVLNAEAGAGWKAYVAAWIASEIDAHNRLREGVRNPLPGGVSNPPPVVSQDPLSKGSQEGVSEGSRTPLPEGSQKGVSGGPKRGSQKGVPGGAGRGSRPAVTAGAKKAAEVWDDAAEAAFVAKTAKRYEADNDGARLSVSHLKQALKDIDHGRGHDKVRELIAAHYATAGQSVPLQVLTGGK